MLTNLADVLREAGLPVVEVAGWKTRGHGQMSGVRGVLWHHTATAASRTGDYPSLGIVRDGRSDLAGPLAHLGLGRGGMWYVIAAGVAYHAGAGSHPAIGTNGNAYLIGIEAEHPGVSSVAWPAAQLESYRLGTAALLRAYGLGTDRCIGHKEWAPTRKVDPISLNMAAERGFVADKINRLNHPAPPPPPPAPPAPKLLESERMTPLKVDYERGRAWATYETGLLPAGNSILVKKSWVGIKALWGALDQVRVTATKDDATPIVLGTAKLEQNKRWGRELPTGTSAVTFEWDPAKAPEGLVIDGFVIHESA